uniref:Uncharacterized protein n=1 Tax=Oryza barthii TaxID=65489 RepID=A0A0D3EN49_9ORYZ
MTARQEDTVRVNIETMLEQLTTPAARLGDGYSIYRVPANVDRKHYELRLVSVGPYHRSKHHLSAMEDRKRLYLLWFLDDGGESGHRRGLLLQDCIDRVRELEPRARACYFESPAIGDDGEDDDGDMFVEMLLLDGCFVVQFFIQWFSGVADPIFNVGWNLPLLHTDLLMLENQIPYFILLALYDAYTHDGDGDLDRPARRPKPSLTSIITAYFSQKEGRQPAATETAQLQEEDDIDHLLHLYHSTFIPRVAIDDSTCTCFMNLAAFEQCRGGDAATAVAGKHLTSYVVLMDYLINTAEDVVILERADVMENNLANEEAAAAFFNQLRVCSYIDYDDHYLAPVYRDVDAFCRRKWPKYKAKFRRDYLNSPWAIVGFCFATTFAVVTFFNTIVNILKTFFHVLH